MFTGFVVYFLLVMIVMIIAGHLNRNPWVYGLIAVILSPLASACILAIWHNVVDKRN